MDWHLVSFTFKQHLLWLEISFQELFERKAPRTGVDNQPCDSSFSPWAATFTAVALPFFKQLSALSGAIGFTPLTFVYPFLFWNRKHAKDASPWVLGGNLLVAILYMLLGVCGTIGALYSIVVNASTYLLFHH
jgi:hypothetical protein